MTNKKLSRSGPKNGRYKHGNNLAGNISPEYRCWQHLKGRCLNKNNKRYHDYGGRGIRVCPEWEKSFTSFLADMGKKPFLGASIERIDNELGYSKDNCEWAGDFTQAHNKRDRIDGLSGYAGVSVDGKKFKVRKRLFGNTCDLGRFLCKHEAAMVLDMFKEKNKIAEYKGNKYD